MGLRKSGHLTVLRVRSQTRLLSRGREAYGSIVGIVSVEPLEDLVDVEEEAVLRMEAVVVFLGL